MVEPVDALIRMFADAGASVISFHPDASTHVDRSLQLIRDAGCQAGLVFNPASDLAPLKYVMDKIDLVLLMSVNPGLAGNRLFPQRWINCRRRGLSSTLLVNRFDWKWMVV